MSRSKDAILVHIRDPDYINAQNNSGRTPISIAASQNMASVVKALFEKGADI
jgi:ankyrin repeat protein